jgi:hypothetical protein
MTALIQLEWSFPNGTEIFYSSMAINNVKNRAEAVSTVENTYSKDMNIISIKAYLISYEFCPLTKDIFAEILSRAAIKDFS